MKRLSQRVSARKLVVGVEPSASGHRLAYAKAFLRVLSHQGAYQYILFTSDHEADHPAVKELCKDPNLEVDIRLIPRGELAILRTARPKLANLAWSSFKRLRLYQRLIDTLEFEPYLVFSTHLDDLWPAIAVHADRLGNFTGVFMRTRFHWAEMGVEAPVRHFESVNKILMRRLLRHSRLPFMTFDPTFAKYVETHWTELAEQMLFLPDPIFGPIFDRDQARKALGIIDQGFVMTVMGLSERKGVSLLRRIIDDGQWPGHWSLLFAGGDAGTVGSVLTHCHASGVRTHVMPGYLTEEAWMHCICASDLVWAVYPDHVGPSGVLANAEYVGRPVIAWHRGLMAHQIKNGTPGYLVGSIVDIVNLLRSYGVIHRGKQFPGDSVSKRNGSSSFSSTVTTVRERADTIWTTQHAGSCF
ncbi:MAG TPA: hypothetical protein VNL74_05715 [Methylococcus sp.]|nr:hypothetical protein [Methylococcus sp.]